MIYITSYTNPDLDGVACSLALAELLSLQGTKTTPILFGKVNLETEFIKNYTKFEPPSFAEIQPNDSIILVDVADPSIISSTINTKLVTEIFDHHPQNHSELFPNAKIHIESIGACATLIYEEFKKNNIQPSSNISTYLFAAIISNTQNFIGTYTTDRDRSAANELKKPLNLPNNFIELMFESKSKINPNNINESLSSDFKVSQIKDSMVGISQIEAVKLDQIFFNCQSKISQWLENTKTEKHLDYILFNGIDIASGKNIIFTIDNQSDDLISRVLNIPSCLQGYKTDKIVLRKKIFLGIEATL